MNSEQIRDPPDEKIICAHPRSLISVALGTVMQRDYLHTDLIEKIQAKYVCFFLVKSWTLFSREKNSVFLLMEKNSIDILEK